MRRKRDRVGLIAISYPRHYTKGVRSLYGQSSETIKSVDSGNRLTSSDNVTGAPITPERSRALLESRRGFGFEPDSGAQNKISIAVAVEWS